MAGGDRTTLGTRAGLTVIRAAEVVDALSRDVALSLTVAQYNVVEEGDALKTAEVAERPVTFSPVGTGFEQLAEELVVSLTT